MSLDFQAEILTTAINKIPNMYGRLNQLDLMPSEGITDTIVTVEEENGILNLLPSRDRRSDEATVAKLPKRRLLTFQVPHIPHKDLILAADIQDVREFGTQNVKKTANNELAKRLRDTRNKHAITLEFLRNGALKGLVLDADGVTVLADFFTEFGITEKVVDFEFTSATFEPSEAIREVIGHIEDNLLGDVMTGVMALASPEWFNDLIKHPNTKEAFRFFKSPQGQNVNAEDMRRGFMFHDILFEEYRGQATFLNDDNTTINRKFITTDEVRFFPLGTTSSFDTFFAPGNLMEAVNTVGLPLYAFTKERDDRKGWNLHTESNPLPMCKRPEILVRGTKS